MNYRGQTLLYKKWNPLSIELDEERKKRYTIIVLGLTLRLFMLMIILTVGKAFTEPYYISDDETYERLAESYMRFATTVVDGRALRLTGAAGYLEVFWPYVMCISAKLLNFLYAGRVINCILSSLSIGVVYDLAFEVSGNPQTSLKAGRLFAFLPVCVLVCCFPIKDIFLTYAVLKAILLMVKWYNGSRITIPALVWGILLLVAVSYTRDAVVESLLIAFCGFAMYKFYLHKQNVLLLAFGAVVILGGILFGSTILSAYGKKVDDNGGVVETGNLIKLIQMRHPWEIYKLPFSYLFATLQPLALRLFSPGKVRPWLAIIQYLNLTMFPIAVGNYAYIVMKKHNLMMWLTTAAMMAGISALSLGISRHYFFLLPYTILNYSLASEEGKSLYKNVVILGTVALFLLIFLMSIRG